MNPADTVIDCGRRLTERHLVWGRSGNISLRLEPDTFLITGSGTSLGSLTEADLVVCRLDGETCRGARRPSMESRLHRELYRRAPDAWSVVHSQAFFTTLVACSNIPVRTDCLPEAMAYLGRVERVRYAHAGSKELADAVAEKAGAAPVLVMNNHGAVCWGGSLEDCLQKTETLEFLCRLLVGGVKGGVELNFLGADVMEDFLRQLASKDC